MPLTSQYLFVIFHFFAHTFETIVFYRFYRRYFKINKTITLLWKIISCHLNLNKSKKQQKCTCTWLLLIIVFISCSLNIYDYLEWSVKKYKVWSWTTGAIFNSYYMFLTLIWLIIGGSCGSSSNNISSLNDADWSNMAFIATLLKNSTIPSMCILEMSSCLLLQKSVCCAACDAGHIVVADSGNHRIQLLATSGELIRTIGQAGTHDHCLNSPRDVAMTSDGHVAVTDGVQHRVKLFRLSDGAFVRFVDKGVSFSAPCGLAATQNNYFVVTDIQMHNVTVIYPAGGVRSRFGSLGPAASHFDRPYFVRLTRDRRIIVSDHGNAAIKIFSFGGVLEEVFDAADFRLLEGVFVKLEGLAVDDDDNILVVANNCICILLGNGRLWQILTQENGLCSPKAIAYLHRGRLLVTTETQEESRSCVSLFTHELEYFKPFKCSLTKKQGSHGCKSFYSVHNDVSQRRENSSDMP